MTKDEIKKWLSGELKVTIAVDKDFISWDNAWLLSVETEIALGGEVISSSRDIVYLPR